MLAMSFKLGTYLRQPELSISASKTIQIAASVGMKFVLFLSLTAVSHDLITTRNVICRCMGTEFSLFIFEYIRKFYVIIFPARTYKQLMKNEINGACSYLYYLSFPHIDKITIVR